MKNLKLFYLFLACTALMQSVYSQAEFKAVVSKNKLGVNQRLKIEFTINKQGADNFRAPNFKNFKIIGGPSQSVNQYWINGRVTFSQGYTYILQPKSTGTLTLGSATITHNGKKLKTTPLKIKVLSAIKIPKNPNDPYYIAQQNVHLVTEISKANPYVGEGVYVEYKLYVSKNISVQNFDVTNSPQYKGFWNQDIKINGIKVKQGKYNGENYRYIVLKRALLIPTKSGKLYVDPMKMNIRIGVPTGRGDFFGNMVSRNVETTYSSSRKLVHVKELPMEGKPENFEGAVGDFNFTVTSSKTILKANESSELKVNISGKGNLNLFEIPKIITPEQLEVYEPEHQEKTGTTITGIRGRVTDTYVVVPEYKGKYKIPSVSFSYFNPEKKKYFTQYSKDIYVNVLEGKDVPIATDTNSANKQNVTTTGNNFRYIQTTTTFSLKGEDDFFPSSRYYLLLLLPLLAIPISMFIGYKNREKKSDVIGNKRRKSDRLAKKYLSEAEKQLGKKEAFYVALEKALHNYLKATLQIETSEISKDKITSILQDRKIDNQTITSFISVLDDCDFARYTPITDVMMKDEYEKAKEVIAQIDKQL